MNHTPLLDEAHRRKGTIKYAQKHTSRLVDFVVEYEPADEGSSRSRRSPPDGLVTEAEARVQIRAYMEKQAAAALHRRRQQDAMQGNAAAMVPFEPEPLEVLTRDLFVHCGLFEFRPHQEPIVRALLERKDAMIVASTGFGKSMCFQLPALLAFQ